MYAVISERDAHHVQAVALLEREEPIVVPHEILVETVSLLQYRHGHGAARTAGDFFRSLPHVQVRPVPPARAEHAWRVFTAAGGKLSLADSVVVAWCRDEGWAPLTFDRDIADSVQ